jgi:transposase InsO family protein
MKSAHFLSVKVTYLVSKYAKIYLAQIVCLHGVPKTIVSDRGLQFMSQFWDELHKAMGMMLLYSTAYHPQTRGQTERVNRIWKIC